MPSTSGAAPRVRRSWWLEEALAADPGVPCPPLDRAIEAEVVIVGGGYTGLWTAYQITERRPDADVVILEQDICGGGPSGRNGGFVNGWWEDVAEWVHRFGANDAMELGLTADRSVQAIPAFCERHGIDAWWTSAGELGAATSPFHEGSWRGTIEATTALGFPDLFRELSREEVRAICDSPTFRTGVLASGTGTVQPARLARGLRRVVLERGVRIYEGTPVRRLEAGTPATVHTPAGRVRARDVVLAINAWAGTWKQFRSRIAVRGTYIVLTEPAPEKLAEINWTGGNPVRDLRSSLNYLRTTRDGRIAFGAAAISPTFTPRIGPAFDYDEGAMRIVTANLHRMFPSFRDVPIAAGWGGPIDISSLYIPYFGTLPGGNVHYGFGYTGNGVGPSHVGGNILAELALHEEGLYARLAIAKNRPPRFPPEPIKSVGMALVNRAVRRMDDAAERGETVGPLVRLLARSPRMLGYNLGPE